MKRLAPILLALLFLTPTAPAEAAPLKHCVFSPTRGWEINDGGKRCRVMAKRFHRIARKKLGARPATSGCMSRRPGRIWRCSSALYRTMNQDGDVMSGRIVKRRARWVVRGLRLPRVESV